jgi:hypothetical protein
MKNECVMPPEIVDGQLVNVIESSMDCVKCMFFYSSSLDCDKRNCMSHERADGKEVYYTPIIKESMAPTIDSNSDKTQPPNSWKEMAVQYAEGADFYKSILDKTGSILGIEVYRSDDGKLKEDVLRIKIPELVAKLLYEKTLLECKVLQLEASK